MSGTRVTAARLTTVWAVIFALGSAGHAAGRERPAERYAADYTVMQDVAYGPDPDQKMDIYLSRDSVERESPDYTVVFLHGGGFYLSDKSREERYIEPYLARGLNVVNLNYRIKRGVATATSDLTNALNYLKAERATYPLNLENVVATGFSAGAQIAGNVGLAQNNPEYPDRLDDGIEITRIINFSGPVDGLDIIERIFTEHEFALFSEAGKALFPPEGYETKENVAVYEPITYFDRDDPPVFLWHGGLDDQIPPETFARFVSLLRADRDVVLHVPDAGHSPSAEEFNAAYRAIFEFLGL